jgi:hypothetical protein
MQVADSWKAARPTAISLGIQKPEEVHTMYSTLAIEWGYFKAKSLHASHEIEDERGKVPTDG